MYFPVSSYKSQRVAGPLFSSDSLEYIAYCPSVFGTNLKTICLVPFSLNATFFESFKKISSLFFSNSDTETFDKSSISNISELIPFETTHLYPIGLCSLT